jgi:hypothetical protein
VEKSRNLNNTTGLFLAELSRPSAMSAFQKRSYCAAATNRQGSTQSALQEIEFVLAATAIVWIFSPFVRGVQVVANARNWRATIFLLATILPVFVLTTTPIRMRAIGQR